MENNKKIKVDATCEPCEEKFQREVNKLVGNVEGYTKNDHKKRKEELKEAFGED